MARDAAGKFNLEVPLDASGIKDFKPDRAVKVVAFDAKGKAQEDVVKLDARGKGSASLTFKENPGSLQVVVGPENATAEQLRGLQTISVDVAQRHWNNKNELTLSAIPISAYYWRWWWGWCTNFKITGRVVCANGNPVPGAQVCAYDVDAWWWWWSTEQVGCVTTDVNGAFEIDFTECCGWWPWYWWELREWMLEPSLAERISQQLRELGVRKPPTPGPKPDLSIFHSLLGEESLAVAQNRSSSLRAKQAAGSKALSAQIDPGALESLRTRVAAKLSATQLAGIDRLRIWPWWPWFPWWDCGANIIFKVTQNCLDVNKVIVNETIWDTRWGIPTNLNVTLVANDQACCIGQGTTCLDSGDCGFISDICDDNLDNIGGNPGASDGAIQKGYLSPGVVSNAGDRPYSGTFPFQGCVGTNVDYYEFLSFPSDFSGSGTPLPIAAAGGFNRSYWDNGLHKWISVPFPFATISDGVDNHNVIESLPHWEANNGAQLWDAATVNILMELVTQNVLADGTYYLRMKGWTRPGYAGNLSGGHLLPVCGSDDLTRVVVTVDNHLVTVGPTDLNGHPCGTGTVHVCTTEPDTEILRVQIQHNDGRPNDKIEACGQLQVNDTDLLIIDFVANDPDPNPHLAYYELSLHFDNSLVHDLLDPTIPNWSLTPSPIPPPWASPAAQVGPGYADALGQGAVSPYWAGGAMRLTVKAKDPKVFPYTCCYLLQLIAHKRTIGSCDHSFWNQYNETEYSFTINA